MDAANKVKRYPKVNIIASAHILSDLNKMFFAGAQIFPVGTYTLGDPRGVTHWSCTPAAAHLRQMIDDT
jgi:hypothetical protein